MKDDLNKQGGRNLCCDAYVIVVGRSFGFRDRPSDVPTLNQHGNANRVYFYSAKEEIHPEGGGIAYVCVHSARRPGAEEDTCTCEQGDGCVYTREFLKCSHGPPKSSL